MAPWLWRKRYPARISWKSFLCLFDHRNGLCHLACSLSRLRWWIRRKSLYVWFLVDVVLCLWLCCDGCFSYTKRGCNKPQNMDDQICWINVGCVLDFPSHTVCDGTHSSRLSFCKHFVMYLGVSTLRYSYCWSCQKKNIRQAIKWNKTKRWLGLWLNYLSFISASCNGTLINCPAASSSADAAPTQDWDAVCGVKDDKWGIGTVR